MKNTGPKILLLDIETAPILAYVWGLWENNVGLNQIKSDWHLLAWSAKWLDDPDSKIMYMDQRKAKNISDDTEILKGIWKLLNEADVIVTQNGKQFDEKKLNARFILNGFSPPSPYQHEDTRLIAKAKFGFTSNKLEYMTDKLCTKHKKMVKRKFAGFELWSECLNGNQAAWQEMEKYNKQDVLSLEELYKKLRVWKTSINPNLYTNTSNMVCSCGSKHFRKNGFKLNAKGKYQVYQCKSCGSYTQSTENLLSPMKKASLRKSF